MMIFRVLLFAFFLIGFLGTIFLVFTSVDGVKHGPLTFLIPVSFFMVLYASQKVDNGHPLWRLLVETYGTDRRKPLDKEFSEKQLHFRVFPDGKFEAFTLVSILETSEFIEIQPTIMTWLIEPILIPSRNLDYIGRAPVRYWRRKIYRIRELNIEILI